MWVKCGTEDAALLLGSDGPKAECDDEEEENALWMSVIAAASALGTSPESLKTQTRSSLESLLIQANLRARMPMKRNVAKDYIRYRQIMRSIEDRTIKEGGTEENG